MSEKFRVITGTAKNWDEREGIHLYTDVNEELKGDYISYRQAKEVLDEMKNSHEPNISAKIIHMVMADDGRWAIIGGPVDTLATNPDGYPVPAETLHEPDFSELNELTEKRGRVMTKTRHLRRGRSR